MRGTVARAATFVVLGVPALLAGCELATSGLETEAPPGADSGAASTMIPSPPDATVADSAAPPVPDDGGLTADDTGVLTADDAPASPDVVTVDAPPGDACAPTDDTAALASAPAWPMPKPPKIDGDLTDWPCDGVVHVTGATAAYVKGVAHPLAADLQVRWDMQNVYVAMHITDATVGVGGYDPIDPYNNDSVEVYVSGDPMLSGDYDTTTHQYVTDYQGLIVDYGPVHGGGLADETHAHFNAGAKMASGGWDFEASIGWQPILTVAPGGGAGYIGKSSIALSFEVNDGDGTTQIASIVLGMAPPIATCACTQGCCCGLATDVPSCDSSRFERVTLQ